MSRHHAFSEGRHAGPPEPVMGGWLITVVCLTAVAMFVVLAVLL